MFRVSLRNVTGRVWSLLLTALSVVLGTAFVASSFVFTDSIGATFDELFDSAAEGTDVVVRGTEGAGAGNTGAEAPRAQLPLELVDTLREVDGVARAEPSISGTAVLVGSDGTAVRAGGAPTFGFEYLPDDPALTIVEGRGPENPDEVAVESATLEKAGLSVGDTTQVLAGPEPREVTVVGRADFGGPLGGATIVLIDSASARALYAPDGTVTEFVIAAEEGVSPEDLAARVAQVVPDQAEAITGQQQVEENQEMIEQALGFLNTFLLVIAAVALLVGALIIFNVFSMLLARRTRELALLRAVGASGGQVLSSVMVEALVVGLIGGAAGLGLGVLLAAGLQAFLATIGFEASSSLPVTLNTVLTTIIVGVVVTVVAAVLPALRASRVPPVAALRDDVALPDSQVRLRAGIGLTVAALGTAALLVGLFTEVDDALTLVGLGVLAIFLGIFVAAPFIARPAVWLLAAPFVALTGVVGRLARQNAIRNPRRTAATAGALMVGTALVGAAAIVTSSINASIGSLVDDELTADFVLSGGGQSAFSPQVAADVADVGGVDAVVGLRATGGQVDTGGEDPVSLFVGGGDPDRVLQTVDIAVDEGDFRTLGEDEMVVTTDVAEDNGWSVGDSVPVVVGAAEQRDLTIVGTYEGTQVLPVDAIVDTSLYEAGVPASQRGDFYVYVAAEDGADLAAVEDGLVDAVQPYLVVSVLDREGFTSEQTSQVSQILNIITALLGLSVLVAVIGIVITLVLSVIERQREIGLLRAVGLSRSQLRRTVTIEGIATSVFGAVLGLTLGVGFGLALQEALSESGLEELAVPYLQLTAMLVGGIVIGALAAVVPAWWASRRNVLEAIATE